MKRRVVVTGTGVVSPLGNDIETLWDNIKKGKSGIKRLESDEFKDINTKIAGYIDDFDSEKYLEAKEIKRYDLFTQYGYAAAMQALEQSKVNLDKVDKDRVGIYIGSGAGGLQTLLDNHKTMLEKGAKRVSPFLIPMAINNMVSGLVAIKTGFRGPSFAVVSACATSNHAIGEAYFNIAHGYSDAILAGGAEATITPLYFAGFSKMRAMSTKNDTPERASRPFDLDRDGFIMSEGAGVLFLEEYEHAKKRGATILGEIIGYGSTTDAYHITAPDYQGAAKAMKLAIERAEIQPEDVDYINAHGTSTPAGDISETKAIKEAFGESAYDLKVSSTKSMAGHLFGAAGAVEAIITLKSMAESIFPPTINLENPDPECDLDYVENKAVEGNINLALSNGFGFGGHNAVIAFKKG
ncbi:beta-ketoacyl-[acyl-carrier-protein] synthase II [Virgibacillus profundi]|uniref:3-oxoacyl-[acyl-carrier-protein] synthase 2 n=1 Tax=Virgibacillus profundi TaxID=2024555 RepID=A0A2A2IEN0_9BACI|nr:beta-ketoacyl-ACP synthase II [Virgibacillus profundi]PAV29605.1 beta-ketoacyl-[acyl-carrier-protein] synthase II [Virgibacillus profundi]PXY53777.1 beta-ketoacyl-[acyl-carrier-protein] synthase II [Virgibacillus profundi]